jgi:hypothetical protein
LEILTPRGSRPLPEPRQGTGKIIAAARLLCAATDPELLPGLDSAILEHDADGTLRTLADELQRELESNRIETVIHLLDEPLTGAACF